MHGANTMALADHDGDGDLDLFWGDFFEPGLLLIPNAGTCPAPNFRGTPVQFPVGRPMLTSGYNAPTFGDLSGDGRADLVVGVLGGAYNPLRTASENLYYMTRGQGDGWEVRTRRLLPVLDIGGETIPAVADLDGDGDLDMLLANKLDPSDLQRSFVYMLENVGTPKRPSFRLRPPVDLGRRFHAAPAFGDLDADGRLDLLMGQWGPRLAWYRGTGHGYAPVDTAIVTITRGSNTVPTLGDLDGDGDLDLLVGESSGWLNYYRNDGGPKRSGLHAGERRVRRHSDRPAERAASGRSRSRRRSRPAARLRHRRCLAVSQRGHPHRATIRRGTRLSWFRRRCWPRPRPGISTATAIWTWWSEEPRAAWRTWSTDSRPREM